MIDPAVLLENVYNMDETGVMLSMPGSVATLLLGGSPTAIVDKLPMGVPHENQAWLKSSPVLTSYQILRVKTAIKTPPGGALFCNVIICEGRKVFIILFSCHLNRYNSDKE